MNNNNDRKEVGGEREKNGEFAFKIIRKIRNGFFGKLQISFFFDNLLLFIQWIKIADRFNNNE